MERRLLTEAKVDARRGIGAVRSALNADGDLLDQAEREAIEQSIAAVETTLSGSDRDAVNAAAETLEHATRPFAERRMDRGIREALTGQRVDQLDV
jgi:molecular chaperone HscA